MGAELHTKSDPEDVRNVHVLTIYNANKETLSVASKQCPAMEILSRPAKATEKTPIYSYAVYADIHSTFRNTLVFECLCAVMDHKNEDAYLYILMRSHCGLRPAVVGYDWKIEVYPMCAMSSPLQAIKPCKNRS